MLDLVAGNSVVRVRQAVAVVTDSAAALPADLAAGAGIHVAHMEITISGIPYTHGPDSPNQNFYSTLRESRHVPKTSAPTPEQWLETFRLAAAIGESIFCVTVAANLSASFDTANTAAAVAKESLPGVDIAVFDSKAAAGSQALIALEAARVAARSNELTAVQSAAAAVGERVRLVAYLDTLEYVWRSGRVPRIAVWASQVMNIKPVMEYSATRIGAIARPRTRAAAFDRLLREARSDLAAQRAHVAVMHADAPAEAQRLVEGVRSEFNCSELFLTEFPLFMGAHTGPGLVGLAYWAE